MPSEKAMPEGFEPGKGTYLVNEIFYSVQGEGRWSGHPMVFVRFARCNLRCSRFNDAGFDCDTDFQAYREMTAEEIVKEAKALANDKGVPPFSHQSLRILLTGGEPALQIDHELLRVIHNNDGLVHVETNGTVKIEGEEFIFWISCSPKSADHTIRQRRVSEVRIVRAKGQAIPKISDLPFKGRKGSQPEYYISPAFQADWSVDPDDMKWCLDAVLSAPPWALSIQVHKFMGVR